MTSSARLYTVKELAALFGASPRYVYRLIEAGELPTVQLGRGGGERNKLRVSHRDVEVWIEANRSTAGAARLSRAE